MFVRRKKNRSGSTSVVVADKSSGAFTELKVIGVGTTEEEIRALVKKGKEWKHITPVSRPYLSLMKKRNNSGARRM